MAEPSFPVARRRALGAATLARNAAADAFAASTLRLPGLERWFRRLNPRASWPLLARVLYGRARHTITTRLRRTERRYQPVDIGALRMVMDITEFTCNGLYFGGPPYEPETTACLIASLREGQTFVDIGASHGYFTIMAALLVGPSGRVFAFEPNPPVLDQLRRHVALNALDNVAAHGLVLADVEETQVDLYVSDDDDNSGLTSISTGAGGFGVGHLHVNHRIPVPATTFDAWARRWLDRRVDLMKIDVEAAEERVVRGMSTVLATCPPERIICEVTRGNPAHDLLVRCGYVPRELDATPGYRNVLYVYAGA